MHMNNLENDEVYRQKYLKYKAKYVALAKTMEGGAPNITISDIKKQIEIDIDQNKMTKERITRYIVICTKNIQANPPFAYYHIGKFTNELNNIGVLMANKEDKTPYKHTKIVRDYFVGELKNVQDNLSDIKSFLTKLQLNSDDLISYKNYSESINNLIEQQQTVHERLQANNIAHLVIESGAKPRKTLTVLPVAPEPAQNTLQAQQQPISQTTENDISQNTQQNTQQVNSV